MTPTATSADSPTKSQPRRLKQYELKFKGQNCFDDGGPGHDMYWDRDDRTHIIEAATDAEARTKVWEFLCSGKRCDGFACDNEGLRLFVSLTQTTVKDTEREKVTRERKISCSQVYHLGYPR